MRRQLHDLFWILLTAAAMAVTVAHEAQAELSRNFTWAGVAADLPGTCQPSVVYNVTDAVDSADCGTGLGTDVAICVCDYAGTGYTAIMQSVSPSVDNSVPSFDGTGGKLQDQGNVYIDDDGNLGVGIADPVQPVHAVGGNGQIVTTQGAGAIRAADSGGSGGTIDFGANTAAIGVSRDGLSGGYDYDGTFVFKQKAANPDGIVEFMFIEEAGDWRFALPSSVAGLGTYNPRSLIIAGPSPNNATGPTCSTWFSSIDCDTSLTGADLGVQDDVEVGGDITLDGILRGTDIILTDATPLIDLSDTDTSGVHRFQSSNSVFIFQVDPGNLDVNSEMQIRLDGNTTPVMAFEVGPEIGVNTPSPENDFHVIAGDTSTAPMVNLEQTSTGDATLAFELTAATSWALGVDNTDADTFKIQDGADGFATGVNLEINTAGEVTLANLVSCDTIDTDVNGKLACGTDAVNATLTQEEVQDYVAELITGNTETGISVTYNDAGDDWNFVTDVQTSDIHGNGANCSAGSAPLGVDALGAVEGCFSVTAKSGEAFVDNRVLRANGTTDVQGSGTTLDDSENISGLNNLTLGGDILGDGADYITIGSYYITTASLGTTAGEDLCRNTSTKRIEECGVSSRRFKKDIKPIEPSTSLVVIQHLTPSRYLYVEGDNNYRAVGLIAEDVADAIPTAARYEDGGRLIRNYDDRQVLAHLVGAVQQLKKEIEVLKDRIEELEPKPPARGRVKLRDEGAQMAAEQR